MQMADELESQPGGARPGLGLRKALALKQRPDLAKEVDQKLAAARNLKCGSAGIPDAKLPHADQRPRYAKPRGAEVLWPVQTSWRRRTPDAQARRPAGSIARRVP